MVTFPLPLRQTRNRFDLLEDQVPLLSSCSSVWLTLRSEALGEG